jgi:hypothetical protein
MIRGNEVPAPTRANAKKVGLALLGGAAGALVGFTAVRVLLHFHVNLKSMNWIDLVAAALGLAYIGAAGMVLVVSMNRRRLARALEGPEAELPASMDEVRMFQMQGAVLGLAGILMLAPLAGASSTRGGLTAATLAYSGIVILFAGQTLLNVRVWARCDEFMRGKAAAIAAWTFAIGQGVLFLYAAAERMYLVPAASSWDVLTMMMGLYFGVSSIGSIRISR